MFNKRSFVLGLGVGIIVGVLLLELFMLGQNSQNKLNILEQEMSQVNLQEEGFSGGEPTPDPSSVPDHVATETPEATFETPQTENEASETPVADAQTEVLEEAKRVERLIRIEPGFDLTKTSELLLANDIIDNAPAFVKQMKAKNKQARAGYFLLAENAGIEGAVKGVTGQPISKADAEAWLAAQ
ncbi:hypothetical protein [Paenibacillus paeoniae]|uniref:Uncharacterized protein n=1 Tax=Paenibacillus paeoniae TaxID=2292705 RepID=A0A371PLA3_9BACL|nr:hypothetical protein [Paenibacillus paeoniae]REK76537.1 hypothetical protein DX130_05715 [Paenibacillus paeoniae]